ncbi:BRD9 isoform 18, partial [Pan troglodytes]
SSSVLEFMSMKSYPDVSVDISMLSSLVSFRACHLSRDAVLKSDRNLVSYYHGVCFVNLQISVLKLMLVSCA